MSLSMFTEGWSCPEPSLGMLTDGWVCVPTLDIVIDVDDILVWGCIYPANTVDGHLVEDALYASLAGTGAEGALTGDVVDGLVNVSGVFGFMNRNLGAGGVTSDAPTGSLTGEESSGGATNSPSQDGAAARILPSGSMAPAGVTALIPKATNNGDCN